MNKLFLSFILAKKIQKELQLIFIFKIKIFIYLFFI